MTLDLESILTSIEHVRDDPKMQIRYALAGLIRQLNDTLNRLDDRITNLEYRLGKMK